MEGGKYMSFENISFAAIIWLCALGFGVIALWALLRKTPMTFWSGSTISPEEITDIPAYNRANAIMWGVYALCMFASGVISLFSLNAGVVLLIIVCVPGIIPLVFTYKRIYKKYQNTEVNPKGKKAKGKANGNANVREKTPKAVIILTVIIVIASVAVIGGVFYYGEQEPVVSILEDRIEIKAQYGTEIPFTEIASISLIEKSMKDIGVGARTNGYGGLGGTLRGNFKSDKTGETLLFVEANSSPTIKIDRIDKRDIYLSFTDGGTTEKIYRELVAKVPLK